MRVLFAASECAPFLKSGGLGDVIEALPLRLAKEDGVEVSVVLPLYKSIKENASLGLRFLTSFSLSSPLRESYAGVFTLSVGKVNYFFIDNEYYFYRDGTPYGHGDDGERFVFFSRALLECFRHIGYYPDIIHLNDWQTAAVPALLKAFYKDFPAYRRIRTLFTIHNIEYQGRMPSSFLGSAMGLPSPLHAVMCYEGSVNLMKSAIVLSDHVSTVSRTYAEELRFAYFSHGLDPIIKEHEYKLSGIVNGINTAVFDPRTDPDLPAPFSHEDMRGKEICKGFLQRELGLPVRKDVPLIAMITRLVPHKGLDLVECVLDDILARGVQLVILGTGDARYEDAFRFAEYTHPDKMKAQIRFDSALASRLYAASDLYLMPSKSEPCGLSQLIAMRYGSIPIVRETGGLFDTVPALNTETLEGRGFTFRDFNAHHMLDAIDRAVAFWHDEKKRKAHACALIAYNSDWEASAREYLSIYQSLLV